MSFPTSGVAHQTRKQPSLDKYGFSLTQSQERKSCLFKTATCAQELPTPQKQGHNQSHFTLWKAGQIKLNPGAFPWFAHADVLSWGQKSCTYKNAASLAVNALQEPIISDKGRQMEINIIIYLTC